MYTKRFSNAPTDVFNNSNYISYVVEYQGDIEKEAQNVKDYYVTIIDDDFAVVTIKLSDPLADRYTMQNNPFPSVVYISRYYVYTPQCNIRDYTSEDEGSISPLVTSNISIMQNIDPLKLKGKGVVVGIICTGIDYLDKHFMNKDGTTRIRAIWDNTAQSNGENDRVPFGVLYERDKINAAITAYNNGQSPYDIVPEKDDTGIGTAMTAIIGASEDIDDIVGASPECEFVIVKIGRALNAERIIASGVPLYDRAFIMMGLQFLYEYTIENNVPMVIYEPFGTTLGNHKINGILEDFIDNICFNLGITVITSTGNQADSGNHTSGEIKETGTFQDVDVYVAGNQDFLRMELWSYNPNIMSIEIFSPSGESTGKITASLNKKVVSNFTFEGTKVVVDYYLPDDFTGDELIYIGFVNIKGGVWKFRIYGDYIINGNFDMWMMPRAILKNDTRFSSPNNFGTITNPAPSRYSVTVAEYNQNNFNIVPSSGVYFPQNNLNQIDIAVGGVDVKSVAPGGKIVTANGSSVSSAIASGASALMFEWGIVRENYPYIYSQTLKTFLMRGTIKRLNDIYPNSEWGYGILDLVGIFRNIG